MTTGIYTDIEEIVVRWLERHKINYQFQTSLAGGFYELGGAVVDVLLPDRMLAWRVMGEYWHKGIQARAHDNIQRELLEAMGWVVVDLWGSDIESRLEETMRKALIGEEILR